MLFYLILGLFGICEQLYDLYLIAGIKNITNFFAHKKNCAEIGQLLTDKDFFVIGKDWTVVDIGK